MFAGIVFALLPVLGAKACRTGYGQGAWRSPCWLFSVALPLAAQFGGRLPTEELADRVGLAQAFHIVVVAGIIVSLMLTRWVRISGDQYVSQTVVSQWLLPDYADSMQSDSDR